MALRNLCCFVKGYPVRWLGYKGIYPKQLRKYVNNRHNLGEYFINQLAQSLQLKFVKSKFGDISKHKNTYLLKPNEFMNNSGIAILAFVKFYKIMFDEILIVHDELDLNLGSVRFKFKGGSSGHNGIKSIITELKTGDFYRLRLGIKTEFVISLVAASEREIAQTQG